VNTVADLLRARADDEHPGLLFEDRVWTWAEVVHEGAARSALARQLHDGDSPFHIGVLLDNEPEYLFWIAGAALAGATIVGINPTRRGAALGADIRHTDCQIIVTDREHWPLLDGVDTGVSTERLVLVDDDGRDAAAHVATLDRIDVDPRSTLLLLFTSGSTGAPKAVICSTGRLAATATNAAGQFGITRDDVLYECMPMFHGNAIMANVLPALGVGATIALRRRFSASGFLDDVRRYDATYFNYVGRALAYILATPESSVDRDHRLRLGFGTEASAVDMERFTRRFGVDLMESYGSTESVIRMARREGCPPAALGLPPESPDFDIAIVNTDSGLECERAKFDADGRLLNATEAIGEIVNKAGVAAFEGYYNNDEATRDRVRNGWYWSGDLGYRDEDGWFYFAGRSADWLRVDSENFAAAPVERILARVPGAVMVAVYPVPDARTGDQVMAAIELDGVTSFDANEFAAFLAAQNDLGTKWAPRFVRIVATMPLLANNKVDKRPLRDAPFRAADEVWWRPGRELRYEPFGADERRALEEEFAANGRTNQWPG
jgi:fatty-acyl-CoA synthase